MTQPLSRSGADERAPAPNVLALDLGGTHLRTALATPGGRLLARRMTRTPKTDVAEVLAACLDQLRQTRAEAEAAGEPAEVLTISAPGPLDPRGGVLIDPPNMHRTLWDFPLAARLSEGLQLPALLERDTQVAALGEGMFGNARDLSDYVYLTVSTGIGGAVVSAGRLLRGPDGVAGELGHISVDMAGPTCGCGAAGHLEAFTSGTGMAAAARAAHARGEIRGGTPLARRIEANGVEALSGRLVAEAEDEGDPVALAIMERSRRAFASAMVAIVDIFNPQRVIVGGGVAAGQAERLLGPAREQVRRQAFRVQARRVEIVPAGLGDDVGLLGGVGLALLPPLEQPPALPQPQASEARREQGARGAGRMTLTTPAGGGEHRPEMTHEQRATSAG